MLPMILCLAQLFSVGPSAQIAFVGLMSSDAPSLYATAYSEALAQFPSLWDWIVGGFHWQYLSMGAIVAVISSQAKSFRSFILRVGASTAIVISSFDAFSYITDNESSNLLVSVAVNILGGLITIFIIGSIVLISRQVHNFTGKHAPALSKSVGLSFVVCGILFSGTAYYVLYFFYQPLPVDIEVSAKMPLKGVMGGDPITALEPEKLKDGAETRIVSLLPTDLEGGNVRVVSPGSNPEVHWAADGPMATLTLKVDLYADCTTEMDLRRLPKPSYTFERTGIRQVNLTLAEKGGDIVLWGDGGNKLAYRDKKPYMYWASNEKEGYSLSTFSADSGAINNESSKEMATFVSVPLLKIEKDRSSRLVPRNLRLAIDGKIFPLEFRPSPNFEKDRRINCRNLPVEPKAGVKVQANAQAIFGAILVRVTPTAMPDRQVSHPFGTKLQITHTNGWIGVTGISKSNLAGTELGRAGLISFAAGLDSLAVDGRKIDINSDQSLFGYGDFHLSFTEDMRLRAIATARGIWLDQKRLNPTKWERLPLELQIFLITSLLGSLYWFRNLIFTLFSRFRSAGELGLDW